MTTIAQTAVRLGHASKAAAFGGTAAAAVQRAAGAASASYQVSLTGRIQSAPPVDYTDRIKLSGNKTLDPLLAGGNRWWHTGGGNGSVPASVARHTLTFSFIGSAAGLNATDATGFQALNASQQSTIEDALDYISSVADVTFSLVSSGGDIQFGSNTQTSSAGYARYPNEGSQVLLANNQSSFSGSWAPGSYEWETILHETSHALGLKHPGNYNAGGGGTPGPYLSKALDTRGSSIMSYNNAANTKRISYDGAAFSTAYVNPDTYQALDIAALQYLYGASTSATATTYSWSADQAISQTIWNPNAASTIDLSNQTKSNIVDLRAGHTSSIAMRDAYADMSSYFDKATYAGLKTPDGKKLSAQIGVPTYTGLNNLTIAAGSHIDHATGGSGNDTFITNGDDDAIDGGNGDDAFYVTAGASHLSGGAGDDTAYVVTTKGTAWTLSSDHATLTQTDKKTGSTLAQVALNGVEHVKFWDGKKLKATSAAPLLGAPPERSKVVAYTAHAPRAAKLKVTA